MLVSGGGDVGGARGHVSFRNSSPKMSEVQIHVGVSLVQPQVSRPEQPTAGPTSADKPLFSLFFWCCFPARGLAFCQLITTRGIPAALMIGQPCLLQPARALYFTTRLYHSGILAEKKSYRPVAFRCDLTFIFLR